MYFDFIYLRKQLLSLPEPTTVDSELHSDLNAVYVDNFVDFQYVHACVHTNMMSTWTAYQRMSWEVLVP